MSETRAVWKDGRIIPDSAVDRPEGCRLRVEPDLVQPGTSEDGADNRPNSPEAIADWLAWYDSLEPLAFAPEEAASERSQRSIEYARIESPPGFASVIPDLSTRR